MNASLLKKFSVRIFLPLLCLALLLGVFMSSAQAAGGVTARLRPDITIVIDGSTQIFYNASGQQVHPISYQDTTYLPLRAIGELMGKNVDWNQSTKTATLSGTRTAAATAGMPDTGAKAKDITAELRDDFTVVVDGAARTFADANGKTVYPLLYQGSTYLPIRAIGELMGKTVSWDGKTNTVTLSGSEVTDADTFSGGTAPSAPDTKPSSAGTLTVEEAKTAALSHAGVSASQATFTKQKLEREGGRQVYDMEFYTDSNEYEYEIDASTGAVISCESESTVRQPAAAGTAITQAKAQEIALTQVPGADASHVRKLKLDRDDGRQIYEVEIVYNGMEYEMDIDASTGAVLKYESEPSGR